MSSERASLGEDLKNKKNFAEKILSFHHHRHGPTSGSELASSQPKLTNSQSCVPQHTWKRLKTKRRRRKRKKRNTSSHGSKFGTFIHELHELFSHPTDHEVAANLNPSNKLKKTRTHKSQWKPSLDTILDDPILLPALIAFTTRSYNEESVLFLQAIRLLNTKFNAAKPDQIEIDQSIHSIFTLYIAPDAKYQVNLSSDCFANTTKRCQPPMLSTYSMEQKRSVFDAAVFEINRLIDNSVLCLFYDSNEFQSIAPSGNSVRIHPPIVLNMSYSAMTVEAAEVAELDETDETDEKETEEEDIFCADDLVFVVDDAYFDTLDMETESFSHSVSSEWHAHQRMIDE